MCLHGTSSVKPADLASLVDDGFVKINIYTTLAVHGGQALARQVLDTLGDVFNEPQLRELVTEGVLGKRYLSRATTAQPKLSNTANPLRRDAWFAAVKDRCVDFLQTLRYERYAR
jgi:hypothetical protein